jgi:hypothetical protein
LSLGRGRLRFNAFAKSRPRHRPPLANGPVTDHGATCGQNQLDRRTHLASFRRHWRLPAAGPMRSAASFNCRSNCISRCQSSPAFIICQSSAGQSAPPYGRSNWGWRHEHPGDIGRYYDGQDHRGASPASPCEAGRFVRHGHFHRPHHPHSGHVGRSPGPAVQYRRRIPSPRCR